MVKMQLELTRQENKKLTLIKVVKDFQNKETAIKYLIGQYEFIDNKFEGDLE